MKKLIPILAVGIMLAGGSCKRTYTCECDGSFMLQKEYYKVKAKNKTKAQAECTALNHPEVDGPSNCQVME